MTNGIGVYASPKHQSASTNTSAKSAVGSTSLENVARTRAEEFELCAKWPCYTWGLLWDTSNNPPSLMAQYSLTVAPVPHVPAKEWENGELMNTIRTHLHLFKVNCLIHVDCFEELLVDYPNQLSICHTLHVGFGWHEIQWLPDHLGHNLTLTGLILP